MALQATVDIKGRTDTVYIKIKSMNGNKLAMWCKVGFFWDKEAASETKDNNALHEIEVPFKPDLESSNNLWIQAYDQVKQRLGLMNYTNIQDIE
jgi:hypothetical protein